jgi:SAM-dependent methyltransferase
MKNHTLKILSVISTILIAIISDKLTNIDIIGKSLKGIINILPYFAFRIEIPVWFLGISIIASLFVWYITHHSTLNIYFRDKLSFIYKPQKHRAYPDIDTLIKGNELNMEAHLCILGYQNQSPILAYKKGLCSSEYEPGTFTLSEICPGADFIRERVSFIEWTEKILNQEIDYLEIFFPDLFKNYSITETKDITKKILTMNGPFGRTLTQDIWIQEYSDIIRRIILIVTINNPDFELNLYPNLTTNRKKIAFEILSQLEKTKNPGLQEWLYISIASGLLGVDEKTNHAATSDIVRSHVISLQGADKQPEILKSVIERLWQTANTKVRVDATNIFFETLKQSSWRTFRIVSFPDDYLESIYLIKFYSELLKEFPHIEIDCVPRSIRCGNDATWSDIEDFRDNFPALKKNSRFRIHKNGPKLGTVNLLKLEHGIMDLLETADIVDARGARNYEMMQGISRDTYFGFMVCREFSEAVTGLFAEDTPLIFLRQPANEKSFRGFRKRAERIVNGRLLSQVTVIDHKLRWEGGHVSLINSWSEQVRQRYLTLQLYYSKNAISFHNKYGDHIELEVKNHLNRFYGRVLVLGCGSGKEVNLLTANKCDAYGIDLSDEAIQIARNSYPHIWDRFRVDDYYNLHLMEDRFDGIVANAAFVHLLEREDIHAMIAAIADRLIIGGFGFLRLIDKKDIQQEYDYSTRWFVYYSLDELESICTKCGLKIIEKQSVAHAQHDVVKWVSILFQK